MLNGSKYFTETEERQIHFQNRIVGVRYGTLTDDERTHLAHVALLIFDITPKAMRKIVNSSNRASTAHFIRINYQRYMERQINGTCSDRQFKVEETNFTTGLQEQRGKC